MNTVIIHRDAALALALALAALLTIRIVHSHTIGMQSQEDDAVLSLPGWTGPLPSNQYSGYLDASPTSHLHYWLVESEGDPKNDPVVFWFNGGPGCSSLDGFFYEMGPFVVSPSNYSQLTLRKYRWNRLANMVVFYLRSLYLIFMYH